MFIIFFILAMICYIPIVFYVGVRLWQVWAYFLPAGSKFIYWLIFIFFSFSLFLNLIVARYLPKGISEVFKIISYYWVVAIFYLFAILLIFDIFRWLSRMLKIPLSVQNFIPQMGIFALALVALLFIYGTWNAYNPKVNCYDINIAKSAGNLKELKAVVVSDLHLSSTVNNNHLQKMVEKINSLNPDIVFIPGDIIEDTEAFKQQKMKETFSKLKPPYGVFVSLGNHEFYRGEVKEIVESLEEIGFQVLSDDYLKVADSFYVVGRDDPAGLHFGNKEGKRLREILAGIDHNLPIILLNHQPTELEEARLTGIDLQVSGHTHKGQVFPANLITSRVFEKDWGYLQKGSLQLIVTSGYGLWGPPLRIGSNSEIVYITISFGAEK